MLGWEPAVDIDEGLRRSFEWYVSSRGEHAERQFGVSAGGLSS